MKFKTSPTGFDFEIPDEWWTFAEMRKFDRVGEFYCYSEPRKDEVIEVVDLLAVKPPTREPSIAPFKKYKLVPVPFALTSPECNLPPVSVKRVNETNGYRFQVTNGFHRYYASLAVGYTMLPVIIHESG
jgi:hypothetical protein